MYKTVSRLKFKTSRTGSAVQLKNRMDPKHYQETKLSHTLGNLFISEPSGRTAPKTTGDGLNKYRGVEGKSLALACAAQGFPAPITRYTPPYRHTSFLLSDLDVVSRSAGHRSCIHY